MDLFFEIWFNCNIQYFAHIANISINGRRFNSFNNFFLNIFCFTLFLINFFSGIRFNIIQIEYIILDMNIMYECVNWSFIFYFYFKWFFFFFCYSFLYDFQGAISQKIDLNWIMLKHVPLKTLIKNNVKQKIFKKNLLKELTVNICSVCKYWILQLNHIWKNRPKFKNVKMSSAKENN